jgi:hypothetical protein
MENNNETMLQLYWPVDQHGYEVVEYMEELSGYDPDNPPIGPKKYIKGKGGPFTQYEPFLGNSAIHRDLAELSEDDSEDADVLQFCGKYGLLDHSHPKPYSLAETVPGGVSQFRYRPSGEMMQSHETVSLDYFWQIQYPIKQAVLALGRGDKDHATYLFNESAITVAPKINVDAPKRHQPWQMIPRDLRSAIWLLVEQEISDAAQWQRCKNCQVWFPRRTARGIYCKDACKTAWHRKQKKEV